METPSTLPGYSRDFQSTSFQESEECHNTLLCADEELLNTSCHRSDQRSYINIQDASIFVKIKLTSFFADHNIALNMQIV